MVVVVVVVVVLVVVVVVAVEGIVVVAAPEAPKCSQSFDNSKPEVVPIRLRPEAHSSPEPRLALAGLDVVGVAKTGSGKTLVAWVEQCGYDLAS